MQILDDVGPNVNGPLFMTERDLNAHPHGDAFVNLYLLKRPIYLHLLSMLAYNENTVVLPIIS